MFISAVCAWPLPEATAQPPLRLNFVLPVGNLPSGVSCHMCTSTYISRLNSRYITDAAIVLQASPTEFDLRNIKT